MARERRPGDRIRSRTLIGAHGERVEIPDPERLVHLQLRRFAGCPVCNLHLRSFARRHDELVVAGVREIAVFHTSADELAGHTADLPFVTIGDPQKALYREFGARSSARGVLDPRAWPTIARALFVAVARLLRGRARPPRLRPEGGRYGLPADLLIAPSGAVLAAKYGERVDDHWEVDEVLALARTRPAESPAP